MYTCTYVFVYIYMYIYLARTHTSLETMRKSHLFLARRERELARAWDSAQGKNF